MHSVLTLCPYLHMIYVLICYYMVYVVDHSIDTDLLIYHIPPGITINVLIQIIYADRMVQSYT